MIEPAAYGAAVVFGPHVWNFKETVARLLEHKAVCAGAGRGRAEARDRATARGRRRAAAPWRGWPAFRPIATRRDRKNAGPAGPFAAGSARAEAGRLNHRAGFGCTPTRSASEVPRWRCWLHTNPKRQRGSCCRALAAHQPEAPARNLAGRFGCTPTRSASEEPRWHSWLHTNPKRQRGTSLALWLHTNPKRQRGTSLALWLHTNPKRQRGTSLALRVGVARLPTVI